MTSDLQDIPDDRAMIVMQLRNDLAAERAKVAELERERDEEKRARKDAMHRARRAGQILLKQIVSLRKERDEAKPTSHGEEVLRSEIEALRKERDDLLAKVESVRFARFAAKDAEIARLRSELARRDDWSEQMEEILGCQPEPQGQGTETIMDAAKRLRAELEQARAEPNVVDVLERILREEVLYDVSTHHIVKRHLAAIKAAAKPVAPAAASEPAQPVCATCNGTGLVGRGSPQGMIGFRMEACPTCAAQMIVDKALAQQPASQPAQDADGDAVLRAFADYFDHSMAKRIAAGGERSEFALRNAAINELCRRALADGGAK